MQIEKHVQRPLRQGSVCGLLLLILVLFAWQPHRVQHAAAIRDTLDGDEEKLIGWKGEIPSPASHLDHNDEAELAPWVEVLSYEPRAFLYHNFLTPKECLYLIHKAAPAMHKSQVVDSKTGGSKLSKVRTSTGTFLRRGEDEIVSAIEQRIAEFTFIPVEHGEPFHILHYHDGQEYQAHFDYFHDDHNTRNGGQRVATVLMYLSDVEEGGETLFPAASLQGKQASALSSSVSFNSSCGRDGLAVKPKRGDALLFWSLKPDATLDPKSLHAGCPVKQGNKWSATKWLRVNPQIL